jgi:hypothetical protein
MIHKGCGGNIIEYIDDNVEHWHPFFVGYCEDCGVAVTKEEVED